MKKTLVVNTASPYFSGILALLLGLGMLIWPGFVLKFTLDIIGWFLIIIGVTPTLYALIKKYPVPVMNVTFLIAGILILIFKPFFVSVLMWIFGLILILGGIQQLNMLSAAKQNGYLIKGSSYIYPSILLLLGVITLIDPFGTSETLIMFFGAGLLFFGLTMIIGRATLKRIRG